MPGNRELDFRRWKKVIVFFTVPRRLQELPRLLSNGSAGSVLGDNSGRNAQLTSHLHLVLNITVECSCTFTPHPPYHPWHSAQSAKRSALPPTPIQLVAVHNHKGQSDILLLLLFITCNWVDTRWQGSLHVHTYIHTYKQTNKQTPWSSSSGEAIMSLATLIVFISEQYLVRSKDH